VTDHSTRLDVSALVNAVARLREGLERHREAPQDEQLRDGLIQRFEYTYELGHRMLRRYLRMTAPSPGDYDYMSFQDLIRTGDEQGLLRGDWPLWRRFRDMRARTSHTYSAAVAEQVVAGVPEFLEEATHLVQQLQQRLR
jgi:nucleotidyltransferase substrate binding protein (TIGR01987 family)